MQELVSFIVSFSVQKTLKDGTKGTSSFTQHVGLIGDNELMIFVAFIRFAYLVITDGQKMNNSLETFAL